MLVEMIRSNLQILLGADKVVFDDATLESRSHDYWLLELQRRLHGGGNSPPACVVFAESVQDIKRLLSFASRENIPVVPFGAGSGVCGGVHPDAGTVVLDVSRMKRITEINGKSLTVTVQPGVLGKDLETCLTRYGYSMGHFPQSINLSSVGGWVATRASGQYSNKYGSIEDMLVCLKAVLADGTEIATRNTPRSSTGPSVNGLLLGSEGTLAVLTELTFKIHPMPRSQSMCAFQFAQFADGLEAVRKILRAGWSPALLRLYDVAETKRHFSQYASRGTCLLLVLSEGPEQLTPIELDACRQICLAQGAKDRKTDPVRHWLEKRFHIPNLRELAEKTGIVFDTIEVAASWDNVANLYADAIKRLQSVSGLVHASAHSSHSYQQGACLYFTFAVKKPRWLFRQMMQRVSSGAWFASPKDMDAVEVSYRACWKEIMEATMANEGTISHHHGIGTVRMDWAERELGSSRIVLERVKQALDPAGVLNPGTLFPRKK